VDDFATLEHELARLKREKSAFQAQARLLDYFLKLARTSVEERILFSVLQQTLQVAADLTGAEKGGLFLLDRNGAVTESILTREGATEAEKMALIGRVLDKGLAAWVREQRRIGLVVDTREDARWIDLPGQPYTARSALAVPILRGEDLLGILTLLHAEPGRFDSETVQLMELTAVHLGVALESARLYSELDRYSKALDAELEKGRRIQRDFLPAYLPVLPGWEIAACFLPARQVSGDFYDAFLLKNGMLCIAIGDVCDKGVGSALFMALIRSLIRVFSGKADLEQKPSGPAGQPAGGSEAATVHRIVQDANQYLAQEHGEGGMFATLIVGILNPETGRLAYVNGGHEPGLIIGASGAPAPLPPTGPLVGAMPESLYRVREVEIRPGETFLAYTDGITEALSPDNALYTRERFLALAGRQEASARSLIDAVIGDIAAHTRQAPQSDDITLIALRRKQVN
jgi:sigma-B regulation protein RsbU (phosphoserine phosphatase)